MPKPDSDGNLPKFMPNDRVWVYPYSMEATVIRQFLHYDGSYTFYGNVELLYDDGLKGTAHSWQIEHIEEYRKENPNV